MFVLGFYHSRSMKECFKKDFTRNAFWCTQVLKRQIVANMALKGLLILKQIILWIVAPFICSLGNKRGEGRGEVRAHSKLKIMKTVCTKKSGSISLSKNWCIEITKLIWTTLSRSIFWMPLWLQWMKSHFDRTDAFMKNILLQTRGISSCKRNQMLCLYFRLCQTRILVTHGIAFLPQVDQIIVLQDGRISEVCLFLW